MNTNKSCYEIQIQDNTKIAGMYIQGFIALKKRTNNFYSYSFYFNIDFL